MPTETPVRTIIRCSTLAELIAVTPPALPHSVRPLPAGLELEAVYDLAGYLDSDGRLALKVRR